MPRKAKAEPTLQKDASDKIPNFADGRFGVHQ